MSLRIRSLKPDFFKDEDLAGLPFETRLCFAGLWVLADREGRLEDRPKRLKVEIFPYDDVDIEKSLKLLEKPKNSSLLSFIQRYDIEGQKYIQIINWHKHQKPHHTEADSKIPAFKNPPPIPPPYVLNINKQLEYMGPVHEASAQLRNGELTVKQPLTAKEPNPISLLSHIIYGEFQNIKLSEDEFKKLNEKFGNTKTKEFIERLSGYIASKGVRYKSHYATILNWERRDNKEHDKKLSKFEQYLEDNKKRGEITNANTKNI